MRECENECISLFLSLSIYMFFYLPTFSDVKFSRLSLKLLQLKLENFRRSSQTPLLLNGSRFWSLESKAYLLRGNRAFLAFFLNVN